MTTKNGPGMQRSVSRRSLVTRVAKLAGATALVSAVNSAFPSGVFAQARGPEVKKAILGYIALMDAAPLIIAKENGLFAKYGMPDVEVSKQASWGTTRDNLVLGGDRNGIDGAHILSPMPYLISTGKVTNNQPVPMYLMARLNVDAQAISVAEEYKSLKVSMDSSPLKAAFAAKRAKGEAVNIAVTFPGGTHDLWMRYWLAAGGIDPDKDVAMIVVPPPQMVANMKVGNTECFCVGEPWNHQLVNQKIGYTALMTGELWKHHPEKALGMRAEWVDKYPSAARAILMAVMEAQQWADKNREALAEIVSRRQWFNVPVADMKDRAVGVIDYGDGRVVKDSTQYMKYWNENASYPFKSHDTWFLTEDIRWGYLEPTLDIKALVNKVNREDLWREAAVSLNVAKDQIPASTSRGKETWFDGKVFDPEDPMAYLKSLAIKKVAV